MALRWLLHSASSIVLGNPKDARTIVGYPNEEPAPEGVKSLKVSNDGLPQVEICVQMYPKGFQMPLHYPRYKKKDYEEMEEWKVDMLLKEYGLGLKGTLHEKRAYAMGAFLWPDQL
ncbi:unnamed protein product [Camellia sinensis]